MYENIVGNGQHTVDHAMCMMSCHVSPRGFDAHFHMMSAYGINAKRGSGQTKPVMWIALTTAA